MLVIRSVVYDVGLLLWDLLHEGPLPKGNKGIKARHFLTKLNYQVNVRILIPVRTKDIVL